MHLKSISDTPSLISLSVTPVPTPGTSAAFPPVPGVVVDDAFELLVPLPHPAASASRTTTTARILVTRMRRRLRARAAPRTAIADHASATRSTMSSDQ